MHTVAVQLAPILGAEKSKVPFYIAGGLLVVWALLLSLGIGARRSDFPANAGQQRGLIAVTVVLVLAAVSMAVVTSGGSKTASAASSAPVTSTTSAETTSTESSSPAATTSLKLAANPEGQLSYDTKGLSAPAGTITITMTNMSPVEHNATIAEGSKVIGATPTFAGSSKTVTVKLKPGKYTFYCSVPGHRQAGMEGTLTVS
jgi:plastocyanin